MSKSTSYDPKTYWEQRLSSQTDISTVGHSGLGVIYNQWLYRRRFRTMEKILARFNLELDSLSVTELGAGSGLWVEFWERHGVQNLAGIDVTQASVQILSEKFPEFKFWQGDIGSKNILLPVEQQDVVTAFDVLFHLTDDEMFVQAIQNLGVAVKPKGFVVISDSFCAEPWGPFFHEYHRTYTQYQSALENAGLRIVHIEPIFFFMTTVLCRSMWYGQILHLFVKIISRLVRLFAKHPKSESLNHLIGGTLYMMDRLIFSVIRTGPSLKFLVAQRL